MFQPIFSFASFKSSLTPKQLLKQMMGRFVSYYLGIFQAKHNKTVTIETAPIMMRKLSAGPSVFACKQERDKKMNSFDFGALIRASMGKRWT